MALQTGRQARIGNDRVDSLHKSFVKCKEVLKNLKITTLYGAYPYLSATCKPQWNPHIITLKFSWLSKPIT